MKLLFILLVPLWLFAQSSKISNIPLPRVYIQNLDIYPCDDACLEEMLEHGQIFSFLAHADYRETDNEALAQNRLIYAALLHLGTSGFDGEFKVAMLLPYKKIGKYAASTTNSAFAYMLTKNSDFQISSFKIEGETPEDIYGALENITEEGFSFVIAPMTLTGAQTLIDINPNLHVYFPTVNRQDINATANNFYFGGIDYRAQTEALLEYASSPIIIFHNQSRVSQKLRQYDIELYAQLELPNKRLIEYEIKKHTSNLAHILKNNRRLNGGSVILNTPLIKSSMIMSQLTLHDSNVSTILSTQINYDPLIFSTTQYRDRKELYIANSIAHNSAILDETNRLLGNDISYDWINYSTSIGVDFFYNLMTGEPRDYPVAIQNNQVQYPIEIVNPGLSKFTNILRQEAF